MTLTKLPKYFKRLLIFVILLSLLIAVVLVLVGSFPKNQSAQMKFGVTFSLKYANYMKLDWRSVYINILDDLEVRNLRIPTYWDILQPEPLKYEFAETDYMLQEAAKRSARVILVLGERQPRWPECHIPSWAKNLRLEERREKLLQFIQKTVERYKDHPGVWAWQVENEPLLGNFGEGCDIPDKIFLKSEVDLVRRLSSKPIIMTDSGELGWWVTSMQLSDIFGTTLYRQVYDKFFGNVTYPLPPAFYNLKSNLIRSIFASSNRDTIIVELQAEPWLADGAFVSADQQAKLFTIEDLKNYVNFSRKTGFDEAYLWGVEWWYWMAQQGYPEYLNFAKTLFR